MSAFVDALDRQLKADVRATALAVAWKDIPRSDWSPPRCPKCRKTMARRANGSTGKAFFGCSDFPKCHGRAPITKRGPAALGMEPTIAIVLRPQQGPDTCTPVCSACGWRKRIPRSRLHEVTTYHRDVACPVTHPQRAKGVPRSVGREALPAAAVRFGRFCPSCREELPIAGDPASCLAGCAVVAM